MQIEMLFLDHGRKNCKNPGRSECDRFENKVDTMSLKSGSTSSLSSWLPIPKPSLAIDAVTVSVSPERKHKI